MKSMKRLLAMSSMLAISVAGASAADLLVGVPDSTYNEPAVSSGPDWGARFGIAFDAYYVDQADNDEGTDDSDWNLGANLDIAVAGETAAGYGAQLDIIGSLFNDSHNGDDDWTESYITGALHLYGQFGGGLLGVFGGGGVTEDTGDSDETQSYWFAGLEGRTTIGNTIVFGQAGYLDADDEFDEGINQAGFGRVGARTFVQPNLSFLGALSGAFGQQDNGDEANSDAWIADVELEAEYGFGNGSTSLFASYEGTFVWFDGGDHNTNFHGLMVGFRWRPGATDLMDAYTGPASLDLPSVDRWVAYTANEVE